MKKYKIREPIFFQDIFLQIMEKVEESQSHLIFFLKKTFYTEIVTQTPVILEWLCYKRRSYLDWSCIQIFKGQSCNREWFTIGVLIQYFSHNQKIYSGLLRKM